MSEPLLPPLRVEKAVELLPDVEALAPLRALLVSIARADERSRWSSSGPYLTLGKRGVEPDELRRSVPHVLHQVTDHVRSLYEAYVGALDAVQRGDVARAVAALLHAGRLEESVGRLAQSRAWYERARSLAATLPDRRPEVELLGSLGRVGLALGDAAEGARYFQRALALAEAEFDQAGAIAACEGLGDAALRQGEWAGAQAWYVRGLRLAEASDDARGVGRLERQLGAVARRQGDLVRAGNHLRRARERLEGAGAAEELAHVLNVQGQLDAQSGRHQAASAAYREALAWMQRAPRDLALELAIRLGLSELLLEATRYLEADEELRRAEQAAIAGNLTLPLVQIYTLMGKLRGAQDDETGFVFFEQAVELCRTLGQSLEAVAQVYFEYGLFRERLGQLEEARAYLERARGIFESLGEARGRDRVETELKKLSA
ncbi:MAG TPA: tetratricopeptide repeat protein [Gemmatimonadales bacterium]|nr:tetratricopeptide repeat protein [Gemmatimonadales bacterium]